MTRFSDCLVDGYNKRIIDKSGLARGTQIRVNGDKCWFLAAYETHIEVLYRDEFLESAAQKFPVIHRYDNSEGGFNCINTLSGVNSEKVTRRSQDESKYRALEQQFARDLKTMLSSGVSQVSLDDATLLSTSSLPVLIELHPESVQYFVSSFGRGADTDTYGLLCYLDLVEPDPSSEASLIISTDAALEQLRDELASEYSFVDHFVNTTSDTPNQVGMQHVLAVYSLSGVAKLAPLMETLRTQSSVTQALLAEGGTKVKADQWSSLTETSGPVLIKLRTPDGVCEGYYGVFGIISCVDEGWALKVTCDAQHQALYDAAKNELTLLSHYTPLTAGMVQWDNVSAIYALSEIGLVKQALTPTFVQARSVFPWWVDTGSSVDNDVLPRMSGFESASLGAGHHTWLSPGYLLADRDLAVGERVQAWVISERDGRIVKTVALTASNSNKSKADWPHAFLSAINAAPAADDAKWMCAGFLNASGELAVGKAGSPTTAAFDALAAAGKTELNRLWYYAEDCRLFSNAPFEANQVIAGWVPDIPPPEGERLSLQVRDRTTQYLYETYLFCPEATDEASSTSTAQQFCEFINTRRQAADKQYGMVRAGVLGSDKVSVSPGKSDNALWIAQHSNLSVELDSLAWQKYRDVGGFTPTVGATLKFVLYDRYSGAQLPGSPFSYTVEHADATQCLAALAAALKASELGNYLQLGSARSPEVTPASVDKYALWVMPLPTRIIVVGVPGLADNYEKALITPEGKALTLGALYEGYKEGLSLTLSDRWNGHAVESWELKVGAEAGMNLQKWVGELGTLLNSVRTTYMPFFGWGKDKAGFALPGEATSDLSAWSLWLPKDVEFELIARRLNVAAPKEVNAPPRLKPQLEFLRDKLVCEEALYYGASAGTLAGSSKAKSVDIKQLAQFGEEVFSSSDGDGLKRSVRGTDYGSHDERFRYMMDRLDTKGLRISELPGIVKADPRESLSSGNFPALVASRVARHNLVSAEKDNWQIDWPSECWVETVSCASDCIVLAVQCGKEFLGLSSAITSILESRAHVVTKRYLAELDADVKKTGALLPTRYGDALEHAKKVAELHGFLDLAGSGFVKKFSGSSVRVAVRAFKDAGFFIEDAERIIEQVAHYFERHFPRPGSYEVDSYKTCLLSVFKENLREFGVASEVVEKLGVDLTHEFSGAGDDSGKVFAAAVSALRRNVFYVDDAQLDDFKSVLVSPRSGTCKELLQLCLSADAIAKGIRFVSHTSDLSPAILDADPPVHPIYSLYNRTGGVSLHIPDGVDIPSSYALCSASYISQSGITSAAPSALLIDPPLTGKTFIPKDSLCADYAGTVCSEMYDVSGASENGVDPKTGLFHAHYPVGVIRGLSGKGPELDLTLHYSATRANESALGDGWAFRFSSYDNRMHRLTLSNGQTITLTADHVAKAQSTKKLPINGVTLTGAKGSHANLTELTVIFPSGRTETLAKPGKHDGVEASENYKNAFSKKIRKLKENLEQLLKEPGVTSEQTERYNEKIKQLDKLDKDMKRKALILVPNSITSPQDGTLTLAWEGKSGHVQLLSIHDGSAKLLSAAHDAPTATGEYSSTFTVWPDTDEAYDVCLLIKDCLLVRLTRQGKNATAPVQTVVFGYEGEPVLDRVLCSVAEEDGSLEVVSYGPSWRDWDINDSLIPLSRVLRHTLVPGAGQQSITHTWKWKGALKQVLKEGQTFSATSMLDTGTSQRGASTRRTWIVKNGVLVESEVVEEAPGITRKTTTMAYPDAITSTDPAVKYRLATQPLSTTVTTEDLRPPHIAATASPSPAQPSTQESN